MVRAEVARAMGRDQVALDELAAVPTDDAAGPMARLRAGVIEVKRGRLRAAEGHLLAAIAAAPEAVEPRRELAYVYALQHRIGDLDRQFEALSGLNGLDEKSVVTWARIHQGIWNARGDLDALTRAVEADPGDSRTRLTLAEGLLREHRIDDAEETIARLPDSDADARVMRVQLALARGDRAGADALLAGGTADHPGLARLRGTEALARRDLPAAIEQFRVSLAAEPNDRASQFGLGTALRLAGRTAEAEPFLESARRFDAIGTLIERVVSRTALDEPGMAARVGAAFEAAGRLAEARAWYRLAIARDAFDEASQQALYRLDRRRSEAAGSR
jgi:tetratricopeptide (TPR) repeat protein